MTLNGVNDAPSNIFPTTVTLTPGTGGSITQVGNYYVHTFTATGTSSFVAPNANVSAQVLVVGGGGGGSGGGGGGGGVIYSADYLLLEGQAYDVTVGAGGQPNTERYRVNDNGTNGGTSNFESIVAYGGGGGGGIGRGGYSGASSGGAGPDTGASSGAATQGYSGANGAAYDGYVASGGGGGAGGPGSRGLYGIDGYGWATSSSPGGNGGVGLAYDIIGIESFYGGGGGGGANTNAAATVTGGLGGLGGGGAGAQTNNGQGVAGLANTGGGGGGGDYEGQGAAGGSGIVIVRYTGTINNSSATEDTAKSIQGIQITDSDSTNNTVTFATSDGTLSVATNVKNGLAASAVSGSGTATLILAGAVSQINTTLAASSGLIYSPTTKFNGIATLTMTSDDGAGGIDTDTLVMNVRAANDMSVSSVTPLILDLNGDSVRTFGKEAGPQFDIAGLGLKALVGWSSPEDGFLVRDINYDGSINDGSEMFGEATVLANGERAQNGFEALSDLDINHDSTIDSQDEAFNSLAVWRDANTDGITDAGELLTLAQHDIASLSLSYTESDRIDNGNQLRLVSNYTTTDGTSYEMVDVWLTTNYQTNMSETPADPVALEKLTDTEGQDHFEVSQLIFHEQYSQRAMESALDYYLDEQDASELSQAIFDIHGGDSTKPSEEHLAELLQNYANDETDQDQLGFTGFSDSATIETSDIMTSSNIEFAYTYVSDQQIDKNVYTGLLIDLGLSATPNYDEILHLEIKKN